MSRGLPHPLVVTGCGAINALGTDVPTFWERLAGGACGIRPLGEALCAAAILDPLPAVSGGGKPLSRTDRLALVAAEQAAREARLSSCRDRARLAVVVGTTTGGIGELECNPRPRRSHFLAFEKAHTAEAVARALDARGPSLTLSTACASGASAILVGAELIRGGLADVVVAGGSDALTRIALAGFRSLRALDPVPCRPFDRARRGLTLGEGAGMLVLERSESASARGASALARLLGAAQTTDAHHLTAPPADGSGAARALRQALAAARISAEDVDHVNAHGTGTAGNDAAEAAALRAVFGARIASVPVTSIKGAIGHTLGAAGALEAVAAIRTLATGLVPVTVGIEEIDPTLGLDVVRGEPRRGDWNVVVSSSLGFGGANAVLCLGRGQA